MGVLLASDLRIGNLLQCAGSDDYFEVTAEDLKIIHRGSSKAKAIPLTEEWFYNFGFEKVVVENYSLYVFDGFMIEIYTDNCVVCYNNSEITKIKFVHSLQNLYFSIKLKELLCDNI